jgi:putative FmdB family regulatory protein
MPIYEFACGNCGLQFEWLVRGDEKVSCPSCGRRKLKKLLSVVSAHVVGGAEASCPAKQEGLCDLPNCGKGPCGFGA